MTTILSKPAAAILFLFLALNVFAADSTPPVFNGPVRDGALAYDDLIVTFSSSTLSANWDPASDPDSGIAGYLFAVGTRPGGTDILPYSDNGSSTAAIRTSLSLTPGTTYYFSVYARNGDGLISVARTSNGLRVERAPVVYPLKELTQEEKDYIQSRSIVVPSVAPNSTARTRFSAAPSAEYGIPSSAKNYQYLPVVRSQGGQGSCAGWASCYYVKTYQEAKEHGWIRPDPGVNPEHVYSPAFGYNLANNGFDLGSWPSTIMALMADHGCATWRDMPYTDTNYTAWPSEAAWRNAIPARAQSVGQIPIDTDTGIQALKQHLANGELAVLSLTTDKYFNDFPQETGGTSNGVIFKGTYQGERGGHALAVIGYDDNKSYFNGTTTQKGAFLIVNSWGADWGISDTSLGSHGVLWISYDYVKNHCGNTFNNQRCVDVMFDRIGYQPTAYGVAGLTCPIRANLRADFTQGVDEYSPSITVNCLNHYGGAYPMNEKVVVDLSDFSFAPGQKVYFRAMGSMDVGQITSAAVERNGVTVLQATNMPRNMAYNGTYIEVSNGTDTTPPAPVIVNDGLESYNDIDFTMSTTQLSANWNPSTDPGSGIARYWYAIGTTPGGIDIAGWTDNGIQTIMTRTGLHLVNGQRYYVSVKAENGAGLQSEAAASNGQIVSLTDLTPPEIIELVWIGTDSEHSQKWTTDPSQVSASWSQSSDPDSGIARYWYCLGTTEGGTDVVNWTDNGTQTIATRTGLSLQAGKTYFVSVKAENGSGLQSTIARSSLGFSLETTPPTPVDIVNDGNGDDSDWLLSTSEIYSNWSAASDPESGIRCYWYAVGSSSSSTDIAGWKNYFGASQYAQINNLHLVNGKKYYVLVKAENKAGLQSAIRSSDGAICETTPPAAVTQVNDGTGSDIGTQTSTNQLSSNWTPASDGESGIAVYRYSIGTSAGGTDVLGWTDNGLQRSVTRTGLTLVSGRTYYVNVQSVNGAGLVSDVASSNGVKVENNTVSYVNVGLGSAAQWFSNPNQLSANWNIVNNTSSPIVRYWYSIETGIDIQNIVNWTNVGLAKTVTRNNLFLYANYRYYVAVYAELANGQKTAVVRSVPVRLDTTGPGNVGVVRDGTGSDIETASSSEQLSANWNAASDPESGIARYWYAIGTTAGGTDIAGWTDNGTQTAVTRTGLTLASGQRYYVSVKAENGAGAQSSAVNSNGQTVTVADATPPMLFGRVYNGTDLLQDQEWASIPGQLSAIWPEGSDPESGIARYWYCVGTTAGAGNVAGWTDNGIQAKFTRTGLSLQSGSTYYITVKAENGVGLQSDPISSRGIKCDITPPPAPAMVNDSYGQDIDLLLSASDIAGNWSAVSDPESGINRYWFAIGTSSSTADVRGWADGGQALSAGYSGMNLNSGQKYYFLVKAENNAGIESAISSSDGVIVETTPPTPVSQVNDGTVADVDTQTSTTAISGNWTASSDPESGIARYWYAIGTTTGSADVSVWTNNGTQRTFTRTGLSLQSGKRYYVSVRSENGVGMQSSVKSSNGVVITSQDITPPSSVGLVNIGTSLERSQEWTSVTGRLSAVWLDAEDAQSGIARYWYCIGTTAGGADVSVWTDNGTQTTVTRTGLSLHHGMTYYVSVKAENGVGLQSVPTNSFGVRCDTTSPIPVAVVNDRNASGSGADVDWLISTENIGGNWSAASDPESGIRRYWFGIGTSTSTPDIVGWGDVGLTLTAGYGGQHFENGKKYYVLVKTENYAGLESISSSDGFIVETTPPAPISQVNDGTGADVDTQTSLTDISANWAAASDPESGVALYRYSIGTTAGGTDVLGWTDNGLQRAATRTGLTLISGRKYYVNVLSVNGAGLVSGITSSNGVTIGGAAVSYVNDGLGEDTQWFSSESQLSANWNIVNNTSSPIVRYRYSIETGAGLANIVNWTNVGMATTLTRSNMFLAKDYRYYVAVYAELANGQKTATVRSNGARLDITGPATVGAVRDGTGSDVDTTSSSQQLSANWNASSDPESGIKRYWYAIGTTAGGTEVLSWTDNGTLTTVTRTGLTLTTGTRYYVNVKAENGAGAQSTAENSNGQTVQGAVDTTPPLPVGFVNDGTNLQRDQSLTAETGKLSAIWPASSDQESGIARYWYCIGTTTGGVDISGWTDNGTQTTVTRTGLSLQNGKRYYVSVKSENGAGLQSSVKSSNGVTVTIQDVTPPEPVGLVNIGTNIERSQEWTSVTGQLSAIWLDSDDPESGIAHYWYCIGTTAGGADVAGWTDNGTQTTVTRTGLSLHHGMTYYVSVKAENGVGLQSVPTNSFGVRCDTTSPIPVAAVNDFSYVDNGDIDWLNRTDGFSGTWSAASDPESGIRRYWFGIGTSTSSADVTGWNDVGLAFSAGLTGQNLVNGRKYYFLVKAENYAGLGSISSSDGVIVETTPPAPISQVNDGTGSDVDTQTSLTDISANWAAASDLESGVTLYRYSIGTTAGGTDVLGWTDNGLQRAVTRTGLSLVTGRKYYVNVLSVNGTGLVSGITSSNGVTIGGAAVSYVNDGLGEDMQWFSSESQLSANWNIVNNTSSPIVRYRYSIETGVDYANIAGWTNAGMATSVTRTGLYLNKSYRYYVAVYAELANGQKTATVRSNGAKLDLTGPGTVGTVRDGTGSDVDTTSSLQQLSANWNASIDPESGIKRYWYAIGTTAGGTNVLGWTDNGTQTTMTRTGLTLTVGTRYYVTVRAENGAGAQSPAINSNGQTVLASVAAKAGGVASSMDGTKVTIPAGAYREDLCISITVPTQEMTSGRTTAPQNKNGVLSPRVIPFARAILAYTSADATPVASLDQPMTISIPYQDNDGDGVIDGTGSPARIAQLCYFDEAEGGWVALTSSVDSFNRTISASGKRFGVYGLIIAPQYNGLNDAICYPNPVYMSRGDRMTIGHIATTSNSVKIQIYTISGELVRTLEEGNGIVTAAAEKTGTWDGRNDNGERVASGVYICLIKGSDAKKIIKAAVIW